MTPAEFERWIEHTEGSVCLECGKCGVKADPVTGLCPACAGKPKRNAVLIARGSATQDCRPQDPPPLLIGDDQC